MRLIVRYSELRELEALLACIHRLKHKLIIAAAPPSKLPNLAARPFPRRTRGGFGAWQ